MDMGSDPLRNQPTGLCEDAAGEALALIQRMAHRDEAALVVLHGMWAPVLLGIAYRMLGDRREAEEVLRATFEQMWKRAGRFDPHQSPPFVWAFVVLRELVMERRQVTGDAARETLIPSQERWVNPRALAADDCRRLRSAMNQLNLEERTCLEHAVFLGFARRETASVTVKNHLRRALETLRNQLSCHEL